MTEGFVSLLIVSVIILIMFMAIIVIIEQGGQGLPEFVPTRVEKQSKGFTRSSIFLDDEIVFKTVSREIANISGTVSRSLLEEQKIEQEIDIGSYTHCVIEVEVFDSNALGSLVFSSEKDFYRKVVDGKDRFEFDCSSLGDNIVVSAGDPALYFWDTTEYEFNARIIGQNRLEGFYSFFTDSGKDYELIAQIEEDEWIGGIDVFLNDELLFSGQENETIQVDLTTQHQNLLRFSAWDESEYKFEYIYIQTEE